MPIILNENVVFVSGYKNGAIYNFNTNEIFALSEESKRSLLSFLRFQTIHNEEEKIFIKELEDLGLLKINKKHVTYSPNSDKSCSLNFVWLEITQNCNLKCIHCYEGNNHKSLVSLSLDKWKAIIMELYEVGCKHIQFIGGEPCCYNDMIDLIDYAGKFTFKSIGFFTNATLINDELIKCFIRNNVKVNVSLYGHNEEIHDAITGIRGSFNKTISNIKKMLDKRIDIKIAITIMRENEEYFENIMEFIKNLGIKNYKFDLVREVPTLCSNNCHMTERNDLIKLKYKTKPSFIIDKNKFDKAFIQNTCWYGKFVISENGDILPCVFERNIKYGNIINNTISNILQSNILKQYWFLDYSKIEECCECEFRYACKDCRYLGNINGSVYKKNPRCLYNPLLGKWNSK